MVFERFLLLIVRLYYSENKEAKASEVPIPKAFGFGTEMSENTISSFRVSDNRVVVKIE
jgi:hypothetical protein